MIVRQLAAEFIGALLLTGVVIGSGILAERLALGNTAVALLGNTAATGAALYVLIVMLGPVSGAHFNPAVTLVMALRRALSAGSALAYVTAQVAGCLAGAALAHAMFALPLVQAGETVREGLALSEGVATFALVLTILGVGRANPQALPAAVALIICAGYWWTPSTSFANPAITIARAMTDTFAGIRPADAPVFVAAQLAGALIALAMARVLFENAPAKKPPKGGDA
ncbi:MAG: MIP/aquaporin family protein [Hyphomonadaceae bacterium]|nr:MIP/aquaporin family protein [Hyphomonadaceae bacterium]